MKYGEHHFITLCSLSTNQHSQLSASAGAEIFWVPEEAPGLCLGAMLYENQSISPKQVSLDLHMLNLSLGRHFTF